MKQCKKFEKQLTAYIHGELSEPDFQSLETHLTSCTSCRAELETMRGTLGILDEVLEEAPAPEQLTARRTIPKRPSVHRPTLVEWWYSTHTRAVLVTAAACSVFFMISLSFVVVRIQQKADVAFEAEVSFDAKEVDRPNMQLKKLKVSVNAKKKNPEPKLRKQIVVKKAQPEFEPVAPAP
ncbi:MAG: zf-HC2 domain-containing protein, partial [Kiritimatiellaceae bacterium]|nr:zf-HC2 domain-containing protein [Kiritimatiellaceae bacterium]